MKRVSIALVAVLALSVTASALATKPGSNSTTGHGRVFLPNPVAELQDQSLTDQKDADYAALQPAYHTVMLTNLDGSGYLQRRLGEHPRRDRQRGLLDRRTRSCTAAATTGSSR